MKKMAGVEDTIEIDTMDVVNEESAVEKEDEVQVAVIPVTTAESLAISRLIVGHRVEEHVMKRKKTMVMLENLTLYQS